MTGTISANMVPTTRPSVPTAAPQVFAIPELLENILLHVDAVNLYLLEHTIKAFKGVMAGSRALRKRMFKEGAADLDDFSDFLEHPVMRRATYPFSCVAVRKWDGRYFFHTSTNWLIDNEPGLSVHKMPCTRPAWWRKIRPNMNSYCVVFDYNGHFLWNTRVLGYGFTLGRFVDSAARRLCQRSGRL
ncbi:hypothetical protein CLAFUW4_10961 [Fulvia fulva]|uniref:F-box domain-containing protein n=1 Tax=Passalora fulva TaxID=5499 RepID=A0A9Q8URK9_PASFU|nr:uncharacterized protein CLAFUR5_10003 [Fulvia fulva]KAK4620194.1 hypothetical protein CLAFUR4_10966 [Fulvia fulva]KAK4620885.1 hypothetical protein CLAFUR0_10973 [Fulvia fulva]UJO19826.1 hypothetical protein CLAFUR5_10003 [Fulvia fulva]WPV17766.1 hypothetical protein CLAFUW4_10961 [Fulvia fulva]WPV32413.1 hypothetical protein CLAFUW7_10959 [Fulvia fulva]